MQEIMIAIVLGIAVGCSDLLNYNVKKWLSRFSTVSLFIMLLCLGAKIGCDAELLGKLDQLGGKSLVMAVFYHWRQRADAVAGAEAFCKNGSPGGRER